MISKPKNDSNNYIRWRFGLLCSAYYGGAVSATVFSDIMGQILRTMNVEPDAIPIRVTRHS